jgi:hypothetical protein
MGQNKTERTGLTGELAMESFKRMINRWIESGIPGQPEF